jgi:hypothetical protein
MSVGRIKVLDPRRHRSMGAGLRSEHGAVFVEFLIVFMPVLTFFLCLLQLALLYMTRLVAEHAAVNAARAAAVVIGDEPKRYSNEPINQLRIGGARYKAIRDAALISIMPLILDGTVDDLKVLFPAPDKPDGPARSGTQSYTPMDMANVSKVRVRIELQVNCKIGLANRILCRSGLLNGVLALHPTKRVRAEAIYPYQGARYDFPP